MSMERVRFPTIETLAIEAIRNLAADSGTVTTPVPPGINILQDSKKNWPADIHKNRLVKIVSGAGAGQTRLIKGNSVNSLVIEGSWSEALDTTSVYVISSLDVALSTLASQTTPASVLEKLDVALSTRSSETTLAAQRVDIASILGQLLEMAPFNPLYLPLSETATAGSTTTVDHYPAENRVWYVSKIYITTTTNTTAKLKIKCDNNGVLTDVEATVPKATPSLEIDLKAEYGMPLRVVQLTAEYVNDGVADEDQTLIIKGVEVIERW